MLQSTSWFKCPRASSDADTRGSCPLWAADLCAFVTLPRTVNRTNSTCCRAHLHQCLAASLETFHPVRLARGSGHGTRLQALPSVAARSQYAKQMVGDGLLRADGCGLIAQGTCSARQLLKACLCSARQLRNACVCSPLQHLPEAAGRLSTAGVVHASTWADALLWAAAGNSVIPWIPLPREAGARRPSRDPHAPQHQLLTVRLPRLQRVRAAASHDDLRAARHRHRRGSPGRGLARAVLRQGRPAGLPRLGRRVHRHGGRVVAAERGRRCRLLVLTGLGLQRHAGVRSARRSRRRAGAVERNHLRRARRGSACAAGRSGRGKGHCDARGGAPNVGSGGALGGTHRSACRRVRVVPHG